MELRASLFIVKGTHVRARWFDANLRASLAGCQDKVSAEEREVVGVVTHVYGYGRSRAEIERYEFVVQSEGGVNVTVKPEWIVEVDGQIVRVV